MCLFGSLENMADYVGARDKPTEGWVSSAAPAMHEFVTSFGRVNDSQWGDPEDIAIEALKIATQQGLTPDAEPDKPWTRGFTLSHADDAEWFAEIYSDVEPDESRRMLDEPADRVLIGAPLWIRTPSPQAVTRYLDLRR